MQNLINDKQVLDNPWSIISDTNELNDSNLYVPMSIWLEQKESLQDRADVAPIILGDTELEDVIESIANCSVVTVHFPAFTDGRGYSQARLLREKYNFAGDIRAIGDVLLDQIFFMKRCGISSYELKEGISAEKALDYLDTFSDPYQLSVERPEPLFLRR